jgi:uncharacterized protein DUF4190
MADETTPPPPPPQPVSAVTAQRTPLIAIWALVLAILSFVFIFSFPLVLPLAIAAVVCGHLARSRIRQSSGALRGMGLALAGLIVGYLGLAVATTFAAFATTMLIDMIRSDRERLHDLAIKRQEIVSDDGKLKVTASGFWVKRTDLNQKASLQAAYNDKDMYVMVLSEPKSTVPNMTLQENHQLTRDHMLKKMSNSSATERASVTVDNHPALQDEVSGIDRGKNIVFLHTTVDEGDSFQQIMAWTTKWHWAKQNEELREVTNSFHSE